MCPGVSPAHRVCADEGHLAAINKRKLLESAQKNLQKGALDKALKDYQALLEADPRDANVRLKVGDLQLKRGQTDDAIAAYLKVCDQFMRDGFDAKAVAIYKQISKIDPKRFDIYIPLADLYQRLGLTSDAMGALQTAAEAYQRDGRRREALDLLRRMASLDPTNTTSRLKVAELLRQEGLAAEALVEFEEAAAELDRQGDWEARAGVLQRIIELHPDRIEAHEALVALWLERGQPRRAEAFVRNLIAIDPGRAESIEQLAGIVAALGDEKGAIDLYRRAAEAWEAHGQEDRGRAIRQRHIPAEPFEFDAGNGATTGREEPAESPFGAEGIGGESPLDEEFRFDEAAMETTAPERSGDLDFDDLEQDAEPEPEVAAAPPAAKPAPAPAPAAPARAAVAEADEVQDIEQLLAEAAVYLRYGKHERAVASLEAVLARAPSHLGALEQLGEAHQRGEDSARAVEVWGRAVAAAVAAGETARAASLRARIEALGGAAPAIAPPPARASAAATVLFDAPASDAAGDTTPSGDVELDEIDIDMDGVDLGDGGEAGHDAGRPAEVEAPGEAPAEGGAAGDDGLEIEIDAGDEALAGAADETPAPEPTQWEISGISDASAASDGSPLGERAGQAADGAPSLSADTEDASSDAGAVESEIDEAALAEVSLPESEPEPAVAEAPVPAPAAETPAAPAIAEAPPASGELSASSGQQILEDLEEAGFYFEQGLLDEAEAIYLRVVQRAPNHPGALLRLGEIAVARGQDPSLGPAETAASPPPPASDDSVIEPPDDLDLTAREFGPPVELDVSVPPAPAAAQPTPQPVEPEPEAALEPAHESVSAQAEAVVEVPPAAVAAEEPAAAPGDAGPELTAPVTAEESGAAAFDLAAELSEALADETAAPAATADDDGFVALFREFKKGVSRTLDEGDVETHFDLGIAYREMGLLDDAIGEFHYALGSGARRLDALHMMGLCALDLGRATDAVGHLEQALASPEVPAPREAALRYDLGRAYEALSDRERALGAFARVVELDAAFQDAAQRIESLRASAPEGEGAAAASEGEAYESFDDLIAQSAEEAPAAPPAPPAETYESFDEFMGDEAEPDAADAEAAQIGEAPAEEAPVASVEAEAAVETPAVEAAGEASAAEEPVAETPVAAEPGPAPEPEPEKPRRRRKISFF
jgi:tetratricopeptide (TPR) repeat protein